MADRDCRDIGIEFGDWRLVPLDSLNWELCHRHATTRGKDAGEVKWNRLGRYYQYSTFGNALLYAADCELRAKCKVRALEIGRALEEYRSILEALRTGLLEGLRETA